MRRRMDREGEVLLWCRNFSGYARQRKGPKLVNCCRQEQMGTKDITKCREESKLSRKEASSQRGKELENRGRKELRERSIRGW